MDNTSDIQTDKFLYEHALGALNGLAIGDALGMPSQTLTTQEIKEHYGVITDFIPPFFDHPVSHGLHGDQVHIKGLNQLTTGKCLAVRAEHISNSRMEPDSHHLSKFTAELDQLAFAGAMVICIFRLDNKYIRVIAKNQNILSDIKEGERFWLSWPNDKTLTLLSS